MIHKIVLKGCDAATLVTVELTDEQLAGVMAVAIAAKLASTYHCYPTVAVDDPDEDWRFDNEASKSN